MRILLIPKKSNGEISIDFFDFLIFIYFFSLHADQLGFSVAGYHIRLNNLITLLLLVLLLLRFRSKLVAVDKQFVSALLFISLSIFASFLFSPYKGRCATFMGWYFLTLLGYVFLPYFLVKSWRLDKVISLYSFSFLCVGLYALLQMLFSCVGLRDPFAAQYVMGNVVRPNAFAYEPSFFALYFTPFIMMCNFHYLFTPQVPFFGLQKLGVAKIIFLNVLFVISTSTSIILAYGVFLVCILPFLNFNKTRVYKFVLSFGAGGIALFILAPFLVKNFFLKFFFFGFSSHSSFFIRWFGIQNAWKVFCENICFGVGLGGYPPYLADAFLKGVESYVFLDLCQQESGNYLKLFEPTSVITEILASLGLVGGVAFCYLIVVFCLKARQAIKNMPLLSTNLLISALVMLVVLQCNQGVLRTYVWTHIAISFALLELIASRCYSESAYQPSLY